MNLFIDTNVFLSFYHLTSEELEELRKLTVLIEKGEIVLWLTQQVEDEYLRNREVKVSDALKKLKEQRTKCQYPAFCKDYDEYDDLRKYQKDYDKTFSVLLQNIIDDIATNSLSADKVIEEIFNKANHVKTTSSLIASARDRVDIGNPPGKNKSLGDAINWESLLENIPDGEDLYLVANDKDYFSLLNQDSLKEYLKTEWEERKKSKLYIYRRLSQFFKEHYPDIQLASELEIQFQIESLVNSSNFGMTHNAISKLSEIEEFSDDQVNTLVRALFANSQILWIVEDHDVKVFYTMLFNKYKDVIEDENLVWLKKIAGEQQDDPAVEDHEESEGATIWK